MLGIIQSHRLFEWLSLFFLLESHACQSVSRAKVNCTMVDISMGYRFLHSLAMMYSIHRVN